MCFTVNCNIESSVEIMHVGADVKVDDDDGAVSLKMEVGIVGRNPRNLSQALCTGTFWTCSP